MPGVQIFQYCSEVLGLGGPNATSIKNNCLMKSEVGMAVLKSKQNKSIVGIIITYV